MRLFISTVVALVVTSCATLPQSGFTSMSKDELAAFNLGVAESDQIYCVRSQSGLAARYVTRKICGTAKEVGHLLNRGYELPTDSSNEFYSMDRYRNRGGPNTYRGPRVYRY